MPAITSRAKPHPQFPVLAVTIAFPIAFPTLPENILVLLLLLRTNKPMRMDFLSIFLEDFRGPRKTVFYLKIMHSKSASDHGMLQAKSRNFQGLVFIPKKGKIASLPFKMKRKNINLCLGGLRMEDQGEWSCQTFLWIIFPSFNRVKYKMIG